MRLLITGQIWNIAWLILFVTPVCADITTPGAVIRQLEQSEQYRKQQQGIENGKKVVPEIDINELDNKQNSPSTTSIFFQLNKIQSSHSDILTEQDLATLSAPYLHHPITLNDLNQLLDKINGLYKQKGFPAARAILPPQKIKNGLVRIRLIEGRVGDIKIQGNISTDNEFLIERLDIAQGELVDIKKLEQQLNRLNLLTDIQVGAALKPGEHVGQTDYLLKVKEPKRHEAFIYMDNSGTKDVGLYRYGFNYVNRSLSGRRDLLNLGGYVARGTATFYAGYQFPINRSGTLLNVNGNVSNIEIVDGPIQSLDITGDSHVLSAGMTHPLLLSRDRLIFAGLGLNTKQSTTSSSGVRLFKTEVNTLDFSLKEQLFSDSSVTYLNLKGTLTPGGWANDTSFFRINLDGSYHKKSGEWITSFRFSSQWSDTRLLPSTEQFQVGGIYTVRGYTEGLLIGDRGYFTSLEFSHAVHKNIRLLLGSSARCLIFFDQGAAFAKKGNNQGKNRDDYLASIGVGLDIQLAKKVTAHVVAGKPLMKRKDNQDSGRVNFTLQANF